MPREITQIVTTSGSRVGETAQGADSDIDGEKYRWWVCSAWTVGVVVGVVVGAVATAVAEQQQHHQRPTARGLPRLPPPCPHPLLPTSPVHRKSQPVRPGIPVESSQRVKESKSQGHIAIESTRIGRFTFHTRDAIDQKK